MKRRIVMVMVLCLAIFLLGCNSNKSSNPIAEVNGEKITQGDFDNLYAVIKADYETSQAVPLDDSKDATIIKNLKTNTYDNLVLQKLIRQDALKKGIKVDSKELDNYIKYIKDSKNQTSTDGFKNFLTETKFTEAGLRQYLETQQLNSKLAEKITAKETVSDTQIRKYYDENQTEFQDPGGIQIYHILVADEKLAQEIINQLEQGADFATLTKQYSTDTSNKDQGGDLGIVNADTKLVAEFKTAALALKPGEITKKPVKSEFGYHIIKAGEKKAASLKTFEAAQADLKIKLEKEQKDKVYNDYLTKLKKDAKIKDLR